MARTYIASNAHIYFDLFGLDQNDSPIHISVLIHQWQAYISGLKSRLTIGHKDAVINADTKWTVATDEFIMSAIFHSFSAFEQYGYTLHFGDLQSDDKTGFTYHEVTIGNKNKNKEWTVEDVGSDGFAKEFKKVTNTDISQILVDGIPSKVINNIAFTIYQNTLPSYAFINNKPERKKDIVTALLIWADEHDEWLFKVASDTPEGILNNFNNYLAGNDIEH